MKTRIKKWGNSLAVRLPKPLAEQLNIQQGVQVELRIEDDSITIRPLPKPGYNLKELLSNITPDNKHEEMDWGLEQGDEIW